jgi:hypothetical protein
MAARGSRLALVEAAEFVRQRGERREGIVHCRSDRHAGCCAPGILRSEMMAPSGQGRPAPGPGGRRRCGGPVCSCRYPPPCRWHRTRLPACGSTRQNWPGRCSRGSRAGRGAGVPARRQRCQGRRATGPPMRRTPRPARRWYAGRSAGPAPHGIGAAPRGTARTAAPPGCGVRSPQTPRAGSVG